MAANAAAIKGRTEKEAGELFGKLALEVMSVATAAFSQHGVELAQAPDATLALIKPALNLISVDGENVQCSVSISVDHNPAGRKWVGKYVYQSPGAFARAALVQGLPQAEVEALQSQMAVGFAELARLYTADARGELRDQRQVKFWSDYLSMRFDFQFVGQEIPASEDRLLVRFPLAVMSLIREQVRWTKRPPKKA